MNAIICPARVTNSPRSVALAPYRLGLTATPERADGRESLYPELIGPIVYRREIKQLAGDFLAEYRVVRLDVDLSPEEMERYTQARSVYRQFVQERGISMGSPAGWQRFIQETCRHPDGRAAFQAYREQKRLARSPPPPRSNCSTNCCTATPSTASSFSPTTTPASTRSRAAS